MLEPVPLTDDLADDPSLGGRRDDVIDDVEVDPPGAPLGDPLDGETTAALTTSSNPVLAVLSSFAWSKPASSGRHPEGSRGETRPYGHSSFPSVRTLSEIGCRGIWHRRQSQQAAV
jgi:hypothetical protein